MTTPEAIEYVRRFREFAATHRLGNLPAAERLIESLDQLVAAEQDRTAQRRTDFEAGFIAGEEWDAEHPAADEIESMDARKAAVAAYLSATPASSEPT